MTWARVALCVLLIAGGFTSAPPAATTFTAEDERAVRALDSAFVTAWLRDDTTGVMNTLAPDAVRGINASTLTSQS